MWPADISAQPCRPPFVTPSIAFLSGDLLIRQEVSGVPTPTVLWACTPSLPGKPRAAIQGRIQGGATDQLWFDGVKGVEGGGRVTALTNPSRDPGKLCEFREWKEGRKEEIRTVCGSLKSPKGSLLQAKFQQ